jgi:DNA polymerase-3 subunit gamma/tau
MAKKKVSEDTAPAAQAEYTVLARRYRPQQFADLIGQEPVAQSLQNAIESNRVAHAYLFTGARGVGKTSTARILAKALNCVQGPTSRPCDVCELCRAIASGDDIDVLEIDGASNNKVDEIRDLRSNVQYRPSRARYKIYIIDEVHMLSTSAFNALLKTLEEPPAHVKFIIATTEVQKIPITILSRCQRFDFAGIGSAGIIARLKDIVAREGMGVDSEALEIIARRAGGSMRDAQSLLDQLLAFGGDKLTAEQVHGLLGTANEERVVALASAVLNHAPKQALDLLGQAVDQGLQLGELLDQLIEYWRDLMVVNCAGVENQSLSVTGNERAALKEQAEAIPADTILAGLDVLVSAKNRMRFTSHARVVFEIALVRLCRLENLIPLSQLASLVARGPAATNAPSSSSQLGSKSALATSIISSSEKKKPVANAAETTCKPLTEESLEGVWQQVLSEVGFILASSLRKARTVAIFGPNTLVLRVPATYNSTGDQYLDANRLAKVEEVLTRIVGQPCALRLEVVQTDPGEQNGLIDQVPGSPETGTARRHRQRAEMAQVPLVGKAMAVLAGQIVQMDEEFGAQTASEAVLQGSDTTEEG